MTKFTAFVIIVALRIAYHPSHAQAELAPFASPSPTTSSAASISPAKLIRINGTVSDNKVFLKWVVTENETANLFEIEKSTDGKIFTMIGLVFGSEKSDTDDYEFYEKAGKQKLMYRIKLVNKDRQAEYSPVVEINPSV